MYCTHYIPSVLICICTINKDKKKKKYTLEQNNLSGIHFTSGEHVENFLDEILISA